MSFLLYCNKIKGITIMKPFSENCKFITDPRFLDIKPLYLYHKENEAAEPSEHPEELKNLHLKFKKCFNLDAVINERYLLRFTADDYAKIYINGQFSTQGPAPGYDFNYYWNEVDVTELLQVGENIIEAEVYYQGLINRVWNSGDLRCGFICELKNGDGTVLCTDESWEYAVENCFEIQKIIGYDTQYIENYDSRKDSCDFFPCAVKTNIDYRFADEPCEALEIYSVSPSFETTTDDGIHIYDLGHEVTGTLKIKANVANGDRLRILCAEEPDESREGVRYKMRCNCVYEQFWTLDDGECEWREFDYKAFRYVSLEALDGADIKITEFSVTVRHYPLDDNACVIKTDNEVLKSVFELCKNGVRCGSQEIYVDCPSREKGQYAGDLTITSASQVYLSANTRLLKKAIDNQMQSAFICDGLMAVTPGSFMQEIADYSLQFPILALRYYEFTGDKAYLAENLKICHGIISYFEKYACDDGLLDGVEGKWNLVDWPDNLRDGYDFPLTKPIGSGRHNVINAFYIGCVLQTERICDILGEAYEPKGEKLALAFNRAFFSTEKGLYVDSELTNHSALQSNVLPLFYGFAPIEARDGICNFLMERGMVCGVYFAYFMLKALCRAGRELDAFSLIISESEHSWYNMVREGGTACFEAWGKNQKWNTSLCHPWASAPISVLIENILPKHPELGRIECRIKKLFSNMDD